jgi:hypothetical protein
MIILIIYLIGVLVARWQIEYWFTGYSLNEEKDDYITMLSFLSWLIYPVYLIEYIVECLKKK